MTKKKSPKAKEKKKDNLKKAKGMVAIRHQKVFDNALNPKDGKERKTVYQAMIDEGYSEEYARGGHLKNKISWQKLIAQRLHDDKLSNIHNQLLMAKKIDYMKFHPDITDDQIYQMMESVGSIIKLIVHGIQETHVYFWCADNRIRKDAVELAYKVAGKMAPEKFEVEQKGIQAMSDQDLADLIKKQKARFKKVD